MYIPNYNSALFSLYAEDSFAVDYLSYVRTVLHRKHYGHTGKYRR